MFTFLINCLKKKNLFILIILLLFFFILLEIFYDPCFCLCVDCIFPVVFIHFRHPQNLIINVNVEQIKASAAPSTIVGHR